MAASPQIRTETYATKRETNSRSMAGGRLTSD
jgi:hypothetical protein